MKFLFVLAALIGLSTAAPAHVTVNYALGNQYYEQGRVETATCRINFDGATPDKFDVCFMDGYTTLGCYEKRDPYIPSTWQYKPAYRSSNLTVLEGDKPYYPTNNIYTYPILIKGLQKDQRTHCQVAVFIGGNTNDHDKIVAYLDRHSTESVLYKSIPAQLTSNPIPFRENTSCHNDTTAVKIYKDSDGSTYTCTVGFSDATQYRQASFSLTLQTGYNCAEHSFYHNGQYRRTERLSIENVGGNVYQAKFSAPTHHTHVCNVRLNDGRSYTSRVL